MQNFLLQKCRGVLKTSSPPSYTGLLGWNMVLRVNYSESIVPRQESRSGYVSSSRGNLDSKLKNGL